MSSVDGKRFHRESAPIKQRGPGKLHPPAYCVINWKVEAAIANDRHNRSAGCGSLRGAIEYVSLAVVVADLGTERIYFGYHNGAISAE